MGTMNKKVETPWYVIDDTDKTILFIGPKHDAEHYLTKMLCYGSDAYLMDTYPSGFRESEAIVNLFAKEQENDTHC